MTRRDYITMAREILRPLARQVDQHGSCRAQRRRQCLCIRTLQSNKPGRHDGWTERTARGAAPHSLTHSDDALPSAATVRPFFRKRSTPHSGGSQSQNPDPSTQQVPTEESLRDKIRNNPAAQTAGWVNGAIAAYVPGLAFVRLPPGTPEYEICGEGPDLSCSSGYSSWVEGIS